MSQSQDNSAPATDRRNFLRCSACGLVGLAALAIPGCGGEAGSPTDPVKSIPKDTTTGVPRDTTSTGNKQKFEVVGNQVRVFLANVPELATAPAAFLINQVQLLVVCTGPQTYGALSAICTHEGCTIDGFSAGRLVCGCHGSAFDLGGAVLVGPATSALPKFTTIFDSAKNQLLINKSG